MKNYSIFRESGNWYKGNLHSHSTDSDGKSTPLEVAENYKSKGYNFLALTDHNIYTNHSKLNSENFIIIPGTELNAQIPVGHVGEIKDSERIYHVVGFNCGREENSNGFSHGYRFGWKPWENLQTVQNLIDNLNSGNNFTFFCHPNWSRLEFEDFKDLFGYGALEIFNYGCDVEDHTGLSIDYWDSLLRRGRKIWGMATDDSHNSNQIGGGWIMVKADELTVEALADAIIEGSFYASSGPEIYEFRIVDGEAYFECSPCAAIYFVAYETRGESFFAEEGGLITSARHKLKGSEKYIRVECVDASGRTAWSNPIFIE